MKIFSIVFLISLFNVSLWGQKVSIAPNTFFYIPETVSMILSDGINLNNDSENATFNGNIKFTGSGEQIISGTVPVNISKMYIDNSGILLSNDVFIISELEMQNGIINLHSNNLTLGNDVIISGNYSNECMIASDADGLLKKNVSDIGTYNFPVGDVTDNFDFTPAELEIVSGEFLDASISISVHDTKHPNNTSSNNYLNRYWQISSTGISNPDYNIVLDYVEDDIIGSEIYIYGALYTDNWVLLNQVSGNQITGNVTDLGDFTGGEQNAVSGIEDLSNKLRIISLDDGFKIDIPIEIKNIDVFNNMGQKIYQQNKFSSNTIKFNKSVNLGIYYVRLQTNVGIISKKILIY